MAFYRGIELGNSYREYRKRLAARGETYPKFSQDGLSILYDFDSTVIDTGSIQSILPDNTANLTFTRASSGSYLDSDGILKFAGPNQPRITYDLSGSLKGIITGPQQTNYFRNSDPTSDPGQGTRTNLTYISDQTGLGFDGNIELPPNSGAVSRYINCNTLPSGSYTIAAIVKNDTLAEPVFTNANHNANDFIFFIEGYLTTYPPNLVNYVSHKTKYIGNGVYLCQAWGIANNNTSTFGIDNRASKSTGNTTYITGFMVFEGHVEVELEDYIKTEGSAVTRNADIVDVEEVQPLIGQNEGTIFISGIYKFNNEIEGIFSVYNGFTDYITLQSWNIEGSLVVQSLVNSQLQFNSLYSTPLQDGDRFKLALRYKDGSYHIYINGVLRYQITGKSTDFIDLQDISIGKILTGQSPTRQYYDSFRLYKRGLTDAELITLTTL